MEPFSKANHLLTDSGKPARGKLKSKYACAAFHLPTSLLSPQAWFSMTVLVMPLLVNMAPQSRGTAAARGLNGSPT